MRNPGAWSWTILLGLTVLATAAVAGPLDAAAGAGWQYRQADLELASLSGRLEVQEIGGAKDDLPGAAAGAGNAGKKPAVAMLMSLVLPGAGEMYLGYEGRGVALMAADLTSIFLAIDNASKGDDKKQEYYDYADAHWFEAKLRHAYETSEFVNDPEFNADYSDVVGLGREYFNFNLEGADPPYTGIPLWVSREADEREWYENLGKWDQFVFGWDDFEDPRNFGYSEPLDDSYLDDPRTSEHREIYREMRNESNDYYDKRDTFVYVSLGLRVFSLLHVAYLQGLIFGGGDAAGEANQLKVSGHPVEIIAEPRGLSAGLLGARIAF